MPKKELTFDELADRMLHLVALKKYDYALQELEEMRKQDPDSPDVLKFFPYVNLYKGELDLAIEQAEAVLGKGIINSTIYYILAQAYLRKRKYKKLKDIIDIGLEQCPNDVPLIGCKVSYLALIRKENEALEMVDLALSIEPNNSNTLNMKARLLQQIKQEGSEEILDLSIANDPMNAGSYVAKGHFYFNKKEHEKAFEYYFEALKLDPENKVAREHLNTILCIKYFPNHFKVLNFFNLYRVRIVLFFVFAIIISLGYTIFSKFSNGSGSWFLPVSMLLSFVIAMLINHVFHADAEHHLSIHEKAKQYFPSEISRQPAFQTFKKILIAIILFVISIYFQL